MINFTNGKVTLRTSTNNRRLLLSAEDMEAEITIDFDDVNQFEVLADAIQLAALISAHWPGRSS